jgi:ADP-ribose pyrophosphatase
VLFEHPHSVILVALDGDELIAVRQTRPGAPERTLELPSGKLAPGESAAEAAARELAEECGLEAASLRELASFWVVPSYSTELAHVFEATGLTHGRARQLDEDEDIEVERIPLAEAWGCLSDASSLAALGHWERSGHR